MTITLNLPREMEQTIQEQARQRDMTVSSYLLDLARHETERLRQEKKQRAIELLKSWDNATPEEIEEEKRAWEFLRKALDEDRLSDRLRFPEGCGL